MIVNKFFLFESWLLNKFDYLTGFIFCITENFHFGFSVNANKIDILLFIIKYIFIFYNK